MIYMDEMSRFVSSSFDKSYKNGYNFLYEYEIDECVSR